ncbi:MAG: EAL domain-containing protein [Bryobacteraceae bacterium]
MPHRENVQIVAIGSSAGGLEALRGLVRELPADMNFAYVVAQHVPPRSQSKLAELLACETGLEVVAIANGMQAVAGRLYVAPPNRDVTFRSGCWELRSPAGKGPKPSVDRLLMSLAEAQPADCVAIILSGGGSDGAKGVAALHESGGHVIVQDPPTAKHPGMPSAAQATGCADAVLPVERIGGHLRARAAAAAGGASRAAPNHGGLEQVLEKIRLAKGVDFRGYKLPAVSRRIRQRLADNHIDKVQDYIAFLDEDPDELNRLCGSCLTPVTSFFRDPETFARLETVIAERFGNTRDPLRVWVPGCAGGEEAYSLAMILARTLPGRRFQIFGTDVDAQAIARARRAVYSEKGVRGVPPERLAESFRQVRSGFQVEKSLRGRVIFARHDLLHDAPFRNLDIVSCRNLLIYCKGSVQAEVLRKFHYALEPRGVLVLGPTEAAPEEYFEIEDRKARIYMNRPMAPGDRTSPRESPARWQGGEHPVFRDQSPASVLRETLVGSLASAAVLVDEGLRVLESIGEVGRYLKLQPGRPELTLLGMCPRELSAGLRPQLYRAIRSGKASLGRPREINLNGRPERLQTVVAPVTDPTKKWFMVAFRAVSPTEVTRPMAGRPAADTGDARELESELRATRETLQSAVEELETANEELHASNLQLQASNEELQSTNEEMVAANEESEHKTLELSLALDDLEHIQNSLRSPLLVLECLGEAGVRVRRYNTAAMELFAFPPGSLGQVLHIPGDAALTRQIVVKAEQVSRDHRMHEIRIDWGKLHFLVRFKPAEPGSGRSNTVVVLFHDVTDLSRRGERLQKSQERLRESKVRLESMLDCVPSRAALLDARGTIVMVNKRWRKFAEEYGLPGNRSGVGSNYLQACEEAAAAGEPGMTEMVVGVRKVLAGKLPTYTLDYPCHGPDVRRWFRCQLTGVSEAGWHGAVAMHVDISGQVRLQEQVARQAATLRTVVRQSVDSILIIDTAGNIDWANEAFGKISGWGDAAVGHTPALLQVEGGGTPFAEVLAWCLEEKSPWVGEVRNRSRAGLEYCVRQTVTPIASEDGTISHLVVIREDVAGQNATQQRMLYMAEHDDLTGLWNRKTLIERLTESIERHRRSSGQVAVLFLDMDRFKNTNDTMGHLVGDRILVEAAQRLKATLRDGDGLARFGGDEFVIYLERVVDRDVVGYVVERLMSGFNRPFEVDGRNVTITASIGVTLWPGDAESAEGLLRNADLAMYRAKAEGRRGYRFYDAQLEAEINERVSVERELNRAIGTKELWVAYQPQWDLRTGKLVGAESLFRWDTGQSRTIPIGRVIEIAEESGMILQIGPWVIREAIQQVAAWHGRGLPLRVSVNLSAVQFHEQDVFGIVMDLLKARGLPPSCLRVEITESVLLNRSTRVTETLHALHGVGVGVVLDDFGTGYSSLTYLQHFPIDMVKIDASFLRGVGQRKHDEAIVRGIIQMAHSLGQGVVAEGVETEEQLRFLKEHGCDFAQGFLLARPLPPVDFDKLLQSEFRGDVRGAGA